MRAVRTMLAAMLMAMACFVQQAFATSFTTDQGDVWAVLGESGWGYLNAQVGSVIFGALYVYDPTRTPIWYTATLTYVGNLVWTGDLYLTDGPWFGTVPFSGVTYRRVGTMTWTALTVNTGQLKYDVDGVFIVKNNVTRLFMGYDDFGGRFAGGIHQTAAGCLNSSFNGTTESFGTINVTQNGQAISVGVFPTTGGSCSYSGTLAQAGQMGSATGTFACSNGETGTFQFYESQVTQTSFSTRFISNSNTFGGCSYTGYAVGMRATTF